MADVFISYSSPARQLTVELAAELEARNISVWWDRELLAGDSFRHEIRQQIATAKAVVVIWSEPAIDSHWVYAEAALAARTGKLVSVAPDEIDAEELPLPFNVFHVARLLDWDEIVRAVRARMDGTLEPAANKAFDERWHGFWLLDPKQEAFDTSDAGPSPASLLLARHALVPFVDLHGLRSDLVAWASGGAGPGAGKTIAGRLLHGPGGLGKTRLAIEVCAVLSDQGWLAGFVPDKSVRDRYLRAEEKLASLVASGRDARPLLLVVDYAESRQDDVRWLAARMLERRQNGGAPARLLLLSRTAGDWWDTLYDNTDVQKVFGLDATRGDTVALPETLAPDVRIALLHQSIDAFKSVLARAGRQPPAAGPSPEQLARIRREDGDYGRPLAVQMEALLHLYGNAPGADRVPIDVLLDRVLRLERDHWRKVLGYPAGDEARRTEVARGVAQTTLVQGAPTRDLACSLLKADAAYPTRAADAIAWAAHASLARLYGTTDGGLAALEPDLIGEHLVAGTTDEELVEACLNWAGRDRVKRRAVLTVLNRATRVEHGSLARRAGACLAHLVATRADSLGSDLMAVAILSRGRLFAYAPSLIEKSPVLDLIFPGLASRPLPPEHDFVDEHQVAELVDDAVLHAALEWAGGDRSKRRSLLTILNRASRGEHGPLAKKAEAQLARLVATRAAHLGPDLVAVGIAVPGRLLAHLPGLVKNVATLDEDHLAALDAELPQESLVLMDLSLAVAQRRLELSRKLRSAADAADVSAEAREALLSHLAARAGTLGLRLSNLGRREQALAASQEAVDIYMALAIDRPGAFLPVLASNLNNTGAMLSNLGRREEALAASREAAAIYRALAKDQRDAFLPDLARSLNNTAAMLSNLGWREEALAAAQEAVDIGRALAKGRPDAFLPDLATSLNNTGAMLSNLGRREQALAASREAVDIYRALAKDRPDAFLADLARSLNNISVDLSNLGRREEALAASREAVDIYRALAEDRPDAFRPDLAMSLNNTGAMLSNLGRREEALAAAQEAIHTYRALAKDRPDAFSPDLARSLNNLGARVSSLGQRDDALAASQEAVDIYRALAKDRPDAFLPDLASSLNNISVDLSTLGRREEALAAAQEAVDIRRALAEHRPDAFLPDLAASLGALAQALTAADRHAEAAEATKEGLASIAPLVERLPAAFGELARALARDHIEACQKAGIEPDMTLLDRIARLKPR